VCEERTFRAVYRGRGCSKEKTFEELWIMIVRSDIKHGVSYSVSVLN
jgi:hypothetical protein